MDPLSEIVRTGILRPEGDLRGKGGLAGLGVGDVLTAVVLARSEGDEVLLSLKGEKITARTQAALLPGDRVSLRVEDLSGKTVLRLMEKEVPASRQIGELLRTRLPQVMNVGGDYSDLRAAVGHLLKESPALKEGPVGALFARLEQVWPGEGASAEKLRAFVNSSGIFYEHQLAAAVDGEAKGEVSADLKTLIIQSQTTAKDAVERNPALRADLDRFLDISGKVLKNTTIIQLTNSLANLEDVQAPLDGGEIMKGRNPRTMGPDGDYPELRTVVRHLLKKLPALKEGPLGVLLSRLEQAAPGEGEQAEKPRALEKGPDALSQRQQAVAMDNDETGAPSSDLKALILDAKVTAREAAERNPSLRVELERFLDISERVLKNTEVVQLANSLINRTEGTFWTVLPYGDRERADSVDWEVRRGGDEMASGGLTFALTFNLSGLGKVKVDGFLSDNRIHCRFWGRDEETALFIEDHLKEFSHSAEEKGMIIGGLASGVAQGGGESPLQRMMMTSGVRLVDRQA